MSTAASLDHVGVAGRDLGAMAAAFERLGFQLTPLARHSGKRTPDGPVVPFGTGNRCIMLRQGYVELIAIVDPAAFSNTLDRFLARYAGIHIIALGIDDETANLDRLRRAGIDIPGVAYLERPVDDADRAGPRARFARLPLPDAPEGRLQLIRHLTPEAIWQERFLTHPNHAIGLAAVVIAVEHPAESAARFSRLAGRPVVPDPAGGFALPLPHGTVRLLPPDALGAVFPGAAIPSLPYIAGIVVRADDLDATARLLGERGVAHERRGEVVLVGADQAAGAAVRFVA
ncbi:MAG TPA: VOC family protein [Acetobacteraceae bacterium]|nr:VOC family protein [Acetobacteraceae bacterium]